MYIRKGLYQWANDVLVPKLYYTINYNGQASGVTTTKVTTTTTTFTATTTVKAAVRMSRATSLTCTAGDLVLPNCDNCVSIKVLFPPRR